MDEIQRKLALIDRELAGGRNLHKKIVSTSPLVFIAVGLIIGILIQDILTLPIQFWLILLIFCAISTIILFTVQKTMLHLYATTYLTCFCFICLGAIRLSSFSQIRPDDISNFVTDERKLATIRGLIITEPYTNNYGFIVESNQPIDVNEINKDYKYEYKRWKFAKFMPTDPTTSFYLKLMKVKSVAGWSKVNGTIRVQVDEPVLDLKAGDSIQAYCWLDRFKEVTNPGQFDIAKYLERRNIFISASIESRDSITLTKKHRTNYFAVLKTKLGEITSQALLSDTPTDSPSQGLLQALLLGYRQDIDNATYEAFRKTGLLHFISLSGMHLGIFVGIIWWLCKTAGLMKHARAFVCIIAVVVFLLIVPPRAPTLRAAIIVFVFCISFFFRRRPNPLNSLSLAAVILLLIRPTQLFEAGWQLSFASVLGILLFCERFHFFLYEKITGLPWSEKVIKTKLFFNIISRSGPYILRLFSTGFTAWLGSAGVLLYHFYTINPFTSIWTVVAFPFIVLILTIGYLKIILSFLLPTLNIILGFTVTTLSNWLIWTVKLIASVDISQLLIGHVSLLPIILYYSLILLAASHYFLRPLPKKAICTVMTLAIIALLCFTKWQRTHRDNLILSSLDVGHGQAILAQLPGKANVLFDAGSMHKNDIGTRIIGPFLDYSGLSKIDAIIISHNDIDHINGIPEIVTHCAVESIYANEAFFTAAETNPTGTAGYLKSLLNDQGLKMQLLIKDINISSKTMLEILWPSEKLCHNEELSDNDKSVVTLIEFAGRKILLCSDIEKFAQKELIRLFPDLKVDVVVLPHHGLASSSEAGFLERLDAYTLICSCDQSQYKKTNPSALDAKNAGQTKSFYTAEDGTITIQILKDGEIKAASFIKSE